MVLESGGWTMYDTVAGVLAVVLLSGYLLAPIQQLLVTTLGFVFNPLVTLVPFTLFLSGLAGVSGVSATVCRYRLQDHARVDQLQSRLTELQATMSTDRQEQPSDTLSPDQQAFLNDWKTMMKLQLRPVVWSMLITVPIFLWFRWAMMAPTAAAIPIALTLPVVGSLPLTATLIGPIKVWIVWYVGGSMSASMLSQRLLDHVIT